MARTDTPAMTNLRVLNHWLPCGGHDEEFADVVSAITTLVNDDPVSRVRPDPPLWRHQTGLGPNYTKHRTMGLLRTADPWYTGYCSGVPYPGYLSELKAEICDLYPDKDCSTNWQMKMRQKILDTYVNIGADIVEINETANMVREAAGLLKDGWVRYVRKKAKKKRRRLTPCDVAAAELITAYGIAPILGTTYDSVQKLNQEVKVPRLRRVAVSATRSRDIDMVLPSTTTGEYHFTGQHERSTKAVAYIEYVIDDSTSGFRLGNPATWVWEKIPFSFVVDWVIPIGGYLDSLTAMSGVNFITGFVTTKDRFTAVGSYSGSEWVCDQEPVIHQEGTWRTVLTEIPQADFPRFDPGMSVKRALNAISLITALSSRRNPACKRRFIPN